MTLIVAKLQPRRKRPARRASAPPLQPALNAANIAEPAAQRAVIPC